MYSHSEQTHNTREKREPKKKKNQQLELSSLEKTQVLNCDLQLNSKHAVNPKLAALMLYQTDWYFWLTSCAVISKCFKEVKGRCGPIEHREELADSAGRWGVDTSHLAIQSSLEMTTLTPQQGRNVSVRRDDFKFTLQLLTTFFCTKIISLQFRVHMPLYATQIYKHHQSFYSL